jgi:hypothetical protein
MMVNLERPRALLLGQSEARHRTLGDINTQHVPESRSSAKGPSLYLAPILNVPTKGLIGPCKRNSTNAVAAPMVRAVRQRADRVSELYSPRDAGGGAGVSVKPYSFHIATDAHGW